MKENHSDSDYDHDHMTIGIREEKRREEKRDDPPVTHQIHPRTPFKTLKLYIPDRDGEVVKVLKEAMKRDASSVSAWFIDRAREWYRGHAPGNPQTPLDKFERTPNEKLQEMTLPQLRQLYEGIKARLRLHKGLPSEEDMARFRLIQSEIAERERVQRLR